MNLFGTIVYDIHHITVLAIPTTPIRNLVTAQLSERTSMELTRLRRLKKEARVLQRRASNAERLDMDYIPQPQAVLPQAMIMPIPTSVAPKPRSVYKKTVDIATAAAVATQEEETNRAHTRNEAEIFRCMTPATWGASTNDQSLERGSTRADRIPVSLFAMQKKSLALHRGRNQANIALSQCGICQLEFSAAAVSQALIRHRNIPVDVKDIR